MADLSLDNGRAQGVVVFGEVLFDRFPDGSQVLGGAPFNVAWNLKGLGVEPLFVSRVGDDQLGERILAAMTNWKMETVAVQIDRRHPTGTVEVSLVDGEPDFDIVADCAYDSIDEGMIPRSVDASVLYHGSLICRASRSRAALKTLIRSSSRSIFFDVNLRSPWWERRTVYDLFATAQEVKMNEDELTYLTPPAPRLEDRALSLLLRHGVERLFVTRGSRGALAFTSHGEPLEVTPKGETRVIDTVGAGDAFSAVLILGRLMRWPLTTTLERAREFSAAVVGLRGATSTERGFYERFATAWRD